MRTLLLVAIGLLLPDFAHGQSQAEFAERLIGKDVALAKKTAEQLSRRRDQRSWWALTQALELGCHEEVAPLVLGGLVNKKNNRSQDYIESYLRHRAPMVRVAAYSAQLGLTPKNSHSPILIAALSDGHPAVRALALERIKVDKLTALFPKVLALLTKNELKAAEVLAAHGDRSIAGKVYLMRGKAPDRLISFVLGQILFKKTLKDEKDKIAVVRMLGRMPGKKADEVLTRYVDSIPAQPPRQSRLEAKGFLKARRGQ